MTKILRKPTDLFAIATVVLSALWTTNAAGDESLDELLELAATRHPDVVIAQAKVDLAQAELQRTRMQVTQQVTELWTQLPLAEHNLGAAIEARAEANARWKEGRLGPEEHRRIEIQLVQATHELDTLKLRVLRLKQSMTGQSNSKATSVGHAETKLTPKGPVAEKLRQALEASINISKDQASIADLAADLSDKSGISFAVSQGGIFSLEITLHLKDVPLWTVLQAIEDQDQEPVNSPENVRFIVRDYGILVTKEGVLDWTRDVSAIEFARSAQSVAGDSPKKDQ